MADLRLLGQPRQAVLLARELMRNDGLLPNHEMLGVSHDTFRKALSDMSPEGKRKVTRAFRKAWRYALRISDPTLRTAYRLSQKSKRELVRNFYIQKAKNMLREGAWS